jgi:two-component system response regulator HydG
MINIDVLPHEMQDVARMGTSLSGYSKNDEEQAIRQALEKANFNKSKAAILLNIDRKTLYNKLKLYNIDL